MITFIRLLVKWKSLLRCLSGTLVVLFTNVYSLGQSKHPVLEVPMGHQQPINVVAFSADGNLVASGSGDNTFIIWDAKTGYQIRKVNAGAPVQQVIFSPDASYVITVTGQNEAQASVDKLVFKKWDTGTGKMIARFPFTGLPNLRYLTSSGNLLVAGYSEDLSKKKENDLDKLDFTDPDKFVQAYTSKINYDSIEKDAERRVEEMMKNMGTKDLTDKKNMEEFNKQIMSQFLETGTSLNPLNKSYALLDSKSFKPVAQLNRDFQKVYLFTYNNADYLLSEEVDIDLYARNKDNINIWELPKLLTATKDKKALPWKKFLVLRQPNHIAVSPAKGFFANDTGSIAVQLWQLDKNIPLAIIKPTGEVLNNLEFSPDGNILYVYSTSFVTQYIEGWNAQTLQQVKSIRLPARFGHDISLSPGGDYFTIQRGTGLIKLDQSGDSAGEFKGHSVAAGYCGFSPGDRQVYVNYYGHPDLNEYILLSVKAGVEYEAYVSKKVLTTEEEDKLVKQRLKSYGVAKSQDYNGYNLLWDLTRGGAVVQKAAAFSPDHTTLSANRNYELLNKPVESGIREAIPFLAKLMQQPLEGVSKETAEKLKKYHDTSSVYFKTMFPNQLNGPVTLLINKKTRDSISLIKIDSLDWIMLLKDGYYMTSKNGAKALSYVSGMQVYPFEQFDLKYNRPDRVLKAIGMADPALIEAYRNAYGKRIKKLGIDTARFAEELEVPEADFANRAQVGHDQETSKLRLVIAGNDKKALLNRFNVWVNEVPVFGKNGKSLKETGSNKLNTVVEITLSEGMNRIETSVMNANGVESYRAPLFVKYIPGNPGKEITHFVGIGIDRFADNTYNLQYSAKDIRDLSVNLKKKYGDNIIIDTLFNENVTVGNIKALKQKLQQTEVDDKVIIAYSGHGMLSRDYDYYLSTYSIDFENPEHNGLPYDDLENLLDSIPARKKLMLIDACHSGEVDKDELETITATADSMQLKRGIKPIAYKKDEKHLGLRNSFELMQSLFVNVGKSTGAVIISAAAGTQFALERGDLKNGVFTYSILEAMNKYPAMKISELKKIVGKRVEELTNGLQQPTSRNETIAVDWNLW